MTAAALDPQMLKDTPATREFHIVNFAGMYQKKFGGQADKYLSDEAPAREQAGT